MESEDERKIIIIIKYRPAVGGETKDRLITESISLGELHKSGLEILFSGLELSV